MHNREILVVGYGSLLSGYGLLAERRRGASRLVARDVAPVSIHNARRGLAKPSSHGRYLAMDIEPVDRSLPITASIAADDHKSGIGGLLLTFDREYAPMIARREEYDGDAFVRLIGLADRAGKPLGEYLMEIASGTNFDLLAYRIKLRTMLDYTSPGYIFHPIEIDDGHIAIIAIGSGFEGSGDPRIVSRRREFGMHRLLSLEESMRTEILRFRSRRTDRILRRVYSRRIAWAGRKRPGAAIRSGCAMGARTRGASWADRRRRARAVYRGDFD